MTKSLIEPTFLNSKYPELDIINIQGKLFGEFHIIYHINDCYQINSLDRITSKHQILFQKFESNVQQLNLVLVDSVFPNILADLALETHINKITSFSEYIFRKPLLISSQHTRQYFKYKFQTFSHYLAFSNISSQEVCKGEIYKDRIYYKKNNGSKIDYYPIYSLSKIIKILLKNMKVKINYSKSAISNKKAKICLELLIE